MNINQEKVTADLEGAQAATQRRTSLALVLKNLDPAAIAGEIRLRVRDLDADVQRLEQAQIVSQELLDIVISR